MRRCKLLATIAFSLAISQASAEAPAPAKPAAAGAVTVFAAASMKNALDAIAAAYMAKTGVETTISYAGSMTLAKQIEAGAPADIFLAADVASMDYLTERKLIQPATRAILAGNALVLVAPRGAKIEKLALSKEAILAALGDGKIATGDVASVPVGKYAKAALEKLGLWSALKSKFAFSDNVRASLAFVAREEAPLGVVYFTDAKSEPKVKVVATFPPDSHPPIVYPVALTAAARGEAAAKFLDFMKGKDAKARLAEQGFSRAP